MTASHGRRLTASLVAAVAAAACSGGSQSAARTSPSPQTTAAGRADVAYIAKARADSARRPYTEADIHFMSGMIGHHAQAIVMAGWAPSHGASASVRTLAERIINAQRDEIATMQTWLRDRQQPVPDARATGMKMMMNGVEHEMLMP